MATDHSTADTHLLARHDQSPACVRRKPLPAESPLVKDKNVLLTTIEDCSSSTSRILTPKSHPSRLRNSFVPIWLSKSTLSCILILLTLLWIALLLGCLVITRIQTTVSLVGPALAPISGSTRSRIREGVSPAVPSQSLVAIRGSPFEVELSVGVSGRRRTGAHNGGSRPTCHYVHLRAPPDLDPCHELRLCPRCQFPCQPHLSSWTCFPARCGGGGVDLHGSHDNG